MAQGKRWIIRFTMPSGTQLAAAGVNNGFAMVPIDPNSKLLNGAWSWDTLEEAQDFAKKMCDHNPGLAEKWEKLKAEYVECQVAQ